MHRCCVRSLTPFFSSKYWNKENYVEIRKLYVKRKYLKSIQEKDRTIS